MIADMSIGERLKALRQEADLTQEQMASIVCTSKQYVSQLESGKNQRPNGVYLEGWARRFRVSLRWLSTGDGPMEAPEHFQLQAVRLDPAKLSTTQDFLERAFGALGKRFDLKAEAQLFADVYEWMCLDESPIDQRNLTNFSSWREQRQITRGTDGKRETAVDGAHDASHSTSARG